jgi:outer membrane cobalamin receptor
MFKQRYLLLFVLLLGFVVPPLRGAENGELVGSVTDRHSNEPLPRANVVLKGTTIGMAADDDGRFILRQIPTGYYTLQVTRIGYSSVERQVQIEAERATTLDITLNAETVKFGEVLITATRERSLSSEVPVATEIITRSKMQQTTAQNVGEVLENVAGIFVKNYGHIGGLKTVSIRGASESQVLILLDGHRLNQAQGIAPDLSDIPLNAIERIEIIRGGHSALYGTDAVGGVINLITRSSAHGETVFGGIRSSFASFGTRIVEANLGHSLGALDYFVAHNYTEGDGDFRFADSEGQKVVRRNNDFKWNNTFLRLRYAFEPSSLLSGYLQFHDADRGSPGPLSFPSDVATQKDRSWKLNLRLDKKIASKLTLQAQTFLYKFKQNFDDSNEFFPIHSQHKNDAYGLSLQSNWRVDRLNRITSGYEFREDKINSTDVSTQHRSNHSFFVQDQLTVTWQERSQLSIVPALRVDKFTDADAQVNPKLGFVFSYVSQVQMGLRGSWGRSYRIPSFNDLYWPAGQFTAGNPNLVPERGLGFDIGYSLDFRQRGFWGFDVTYFNTDLDNLIIWGPDEAGVWSPQNVQKANIEGVETKLSFQGIGDLLALEADYNYLDATDASRDIASNGKQLIYRPKHKLDLDLTLRLGKFELNGVYRFVGLRFTNSDNLGSLDSYSLIDLGSKWKQPFGDSGVTAQLEIRNISNKDFQIIEGFPMPGREYRTTFGFEF